MKTANFDIMENLGNLALGIAVVGLMSAFMLEILGGQKDDFASCSGVGGCTYSASTDNCLNASGVVGACVVVKDSSYNATMDAITGTAKVPAKLGTVATVGIAVFIISLLLVGFAMIRNKN